MINFEFVGTHLNEDDTVQLEFVLHDLLGLTQEDLFGPLELTEYTINVINMEYRPIPCAMVLDLVVTDDSAIATPRFITLGFKDPVLSSAYEGLLDNNPNVLLDINLSQITRFNTSFYDFAKQQQML